MTYVSVLVLIWLLFSVPFPNIHCPFGRLGPYSIGVLEKRSNQGFVQQYKYLIINTFKIPSYESNSLSCFHRACKMYPCPASLGGAISPTMSTATLLNNVSINGIDPNYCLLSLNNKITIKSIFVCAI